MSADRKANPSVNGILEACLYVDDLEAAQVFYTQVLGLEVYSAATGRDLFFRCGRSMFLLFNPKRTQTPFTSVPAHGAEGPGHVAFSVAEEDFDRWRLHLEAHGVKIEKEVRWPNQARSLYFRDPDGNALELATPRLWELESLESQP